MEKPKKVSFIKLYFKKFKNNNTFKQIMKNKFVLPTLLILIFFISGCINQETENHDALAKCLTEKGVKMYGTYVCPACAQQKDLFGDSFQHIDYIECHPRAENSQYELCEDIERVPTWEFPDGTRVTGVQKLEALAVLSDCIIQ
jgi:hypothetical protein